jgi:hypothetical protein
VRVKRIGRTAAFAAAALAGVALVQPAHAALGGAPAAFSDSTAVRLLQRSVAASTAVAGASSAGTANYSVRETTLSSGTVVREYLSADGKVFGVAWQGPLRPSFDTLFGDTYFSQFSSDVAAAHAASGARAPVSIDTSGLVVHLGGHMRAHFGQAWLPQALPAGVSSSDIQ